jgi:hypothetical protein
MNVQLDLYLYLPTHLYHGAPDLFVRGCVRVDVPSRCTVSYIECKATYYSNQGAPLLELS